MASTAAIPAWEPEAQYADHPALKEIAIALINRHESIAVMVSDLRIGYRLRLGEPSGRGEGLLAACVKVPTIWRDETRLDIVIWTWEDAWTVLDSRQREALAAHELLHIGRTEKGGIQLRVHDIGEFSWVVRQYGAWLPDVAGFADALSRYDEAKVTRLPAGRERRRPGSRGEPVVTP